MSDIDLRELKAFIGVAESASFTEAAVQMGISQSALTRQIQSLEEKLGKQLLSRTTRSSRLTREGKFWLEQSRQIVAQTDTALGTFNEKFTDAAPVVRVGVCSTISLAYLPGFFHGYRRHFPDTQVFINQGNETELVQNLDRCLIDIAILAKPDTSISGIEITHSFEDEYILIGPANSELTVDLERINQLPLIEIDSQSATGKQLHNWKRKHNINQAPMMEFNNYDLIIHSVALGLGHALVPRRALAIYGKNKKIKRYALEQRPSRELCALARSELNRPAIIQAFIDHILY